MQFDSKNLQIITWSQSEDTYISETAEEHLMRNWEIFSGQSSNKSDRIAIGYANSEIKAAQKIDVLKQKRSRFIAIKKGEVENEWIQKHILKWGYISFDRTDVQEIFGTDDNNGIFNLRQFAEQLNYHLKLPPDTHYFVIESRKA